MRSCRVQAHGRMIHIDRQLKSISVFPAMPFHFVTFPLPGPIRSFVFVYWNQLLFQPSYHLISECGRSVMAFSPKGGYVQSLTAMNVIPILVSPCQLPFHLTTSQSYLPRIQLVTGQMGLPKKLRLKAPSRVVSTL